MSDKKMCFAVCCNCSHTVIKETINEFPGPKVFWIVNAKTFFDIAICFAKARTTKCWCELKNHKCNYCKSINPGLFAAFHFYYKNLKQKEVVSKAQIEFTHTSGLSKEHCFETEIFETICVENDKEREQYMSDYAFE